MTQIEPELQSLLEVLQGPAALLSTDYELLAVNRHYRRDYGEIRHQGDPLHCYEVSHHYTVPCDQAGEDCPIRNCRETGQPSRMLHLHHTPRGEEHVEVEAWPIRGANGQIRYFLERMRRSSLGAVDPGSDGMLGRSASFNRVLEMVQRAAPSMTTVLLLGESGTGKEVVASAIHANSQRANGPFVPVECSGLTETLFESELFGHEKGAFTGAVNRKIGLVEAARGGTLFLDEIGDVPLPLQVKLLRLLETGTYRRVGGVESHQAEFRLVCATHRRLKQMVDDGSFRQDLYYRINTFPIELPALRERTEDIALLSVNLLKRLAPERPIQLADEAQACLEGYRFPGNIRELRNILERALLLADGDRILPEHLPEECRVQQAEDQQTGILNLDQVEARHLRWAVAHFDGDRKKLATQLGVSERTLYRKLQQHKIPMPRTLR